MPVRVGISGLRIALRRGRRERNERPVISIHPERMRVCSRESEAMNLNTHMTSLLVLALTGFILTSGPPASGQGDDDERYVYPTLPERGVGSTSFVPPRWHLLDSTVGDLNRDNLPDLVVVVERDSTVSEERRTLDGIFAVEGRPRILAISLADPESGGYRKVIQTDQFVLREREGGVMDDPWNGMEVRQGLLNVRFQGGSGMLWGLEYKFAWRERSWQLVGVTSTEVNRRNGDSVADEYDLLTWSVITWKANISPDGCRPCNDCADCAQHSDCPDCSEKVGSQPRRSVRQLKKEEPRFLSDFEPNLWEIEPNKRI
jgi:hypothetical protein